jgi:transposase
MEAAVQIVKAAEDILKNCQTSETPGDIPEYIQCIPIVEKLYNQGLPLKEIAKHCNNSMSTVYRALRLLEELGLIRRRRGRYRKHRRVTPEEEEKIAELYKRGYSMYQIAKLLNRPESTVYNVLKRRGLR